MKGAITIQRAAKDKGSKNFVNVGGVPIMRKASNAPKEENSKPMTKFVIQNVKVFPVLSRAVDSVELAVWVAALVVA